MGSESSDSDNLVSVRRLRAAAHALDAMEPAFELERLDGSHDGPSNGAFALAAVLIAAGISSVIWRADATGLVVAVVAFACAGLAYLLALRKAPQASSFRYVWLDKGGVHHRDEPAGRVARFAWSEIESVNAMVEDAPAVQLILTRVGLRGAPIVLSTASREHARQLEERIRLESTRRPPDPSFSGPASGR